MPGLRWTQQDLDEYRLKAHRSEKCNDPTNNALGSANSGCKLQPSDQETDSEAQLQLQIETWATEHGYYWFHDRSRKYNSPGHPDLVIALPNGRVVWLELKSKRGRLTLDQQRVRLMLQYLGHEFYVVRSFTQFMEAIT